METQKIPELPKSYEPKSIEGKWYPFWELNRFFVADARSTKPAFSIVIPPPNVTGSLHMGHMLVYTLHDIVVRWRRMQGFNTLWLPGTDHAGIGTQFVVERQLAAEGKSRQDLGREAFEKRVWEWKEQSGNTILKQLRLLGGSCDWTRERFTLDEGLSRAVREVFVQLYNEGLIYRGKRLINWCVRCRTALSDLEVKSEPVQGKLYSVRYPVKGSTESVTVATTRPETLLGDTAVAFNPQDQRYFSMRNETLVLPLLHREIPLIEDEFVDPEFGTGLVKVTPAHDPNDFEMGMRHHLPMISVIDEDGRMTKEAGPFQGLDRFECRREVVRELQAQGLLEKVEDHLHNVGHCDRCKTIIEPRVSVQWFVKTKPLAEPAIAAVEDGRVRFVPDNWAKTYFEWMRNIKDWCISRQLWWGHRIPAWYCDQCGEVIVARETPQACSQCGSSSLTQETDVLDTWFSSGLWPFSTMGWPESTEDLTVFYPTSLLITAFDILFFWVARMIMLGMKFMGEVPFHIVYIHSLVRDAEGQKMSKSKGNVIDPLQVMEKYGTDAVRFTLAIMAAPGTDISLSHEKMLSHRAFANKIWNATRFVLMNQDHPTRRASGIVSISTLQQELVSRRSELSLVDRWILSRLANVIKECQTSLESFRFHEASHYLYHFFWHELCDWYLEFLKPRILDSTELEDHQLSFLVVHFVFDQALKLLHPFMPFITEELWQRLPHEGDALAIAPFPVSREEFIDLEAEKSIATLEDVIVKIRNVRAEMNIQPSRKIDVNLASSDPTIVTILQEGLIHILNLARCANVNILSSLKNLEHSARRVALGVEIEIPLVGLIDFEAERAKLEKEIAGAEKEMFQIQQKLSNPDFLSGAPESVVQSNRERLLLATDKFQKLRESLSRL